MCVREEFVFWIGVCPSILSTFSFSSPLTPQYYPSFSPSLTPTIIYVVTTLAGGGSAGGTAAGFTNGVGTAATFTSPVAVALTFATSGVSVNVLYVASTTQIRTINLNTLAVATLSGSTTGASGSQTTFGTSVAFIDAVYAGLSSIALDYAGVNLYVAEATNKMILRLSVSNTSLTGVFKVNSSDTSAVVCGKSWSGANSNAYVYYTVLSPGMHIRNNSAGAWFAGSTINTGYVDGPVGSAQFTKLTGIGGTSSYLVVADTQTPGSVLRVVQEGVVFTLAGQATASGFTDGIGTSATFGTLVQSIITDTPITQVFVTDFNNNAIRRIGVADKGVTTIAGGNRNTGTSGFVDGVATNSLFNGPKGIAVSTGGYVYVADTANNVIRILRPY